MKGIFLLNPLTEAIFNQHGNLCMNDNYYQLRSYEKYFSHFSHMRGDLFSSTVLANFEYLERYFCVAYGLCK
jgi:hypothetical protein